MSNETVSQEILDQRNKPVRFPWWFSWINRERHSAWSMRQNLDAILRLNPILSDLQAEHAKNPSQVTMAIVPQIGLLVGMYDDKLRAVSLRIPCTHNALKNLFADEKYQRILGYTIVSSTDDLADLEQRVSDWPKNRYNTEGKQPYDFNQYSMTPQDYLALTLQGKLTETNPLMEFDGKKWEPAPYWQQRVFGIFRRGFLGNVGRL